MVVVLAVGVVATACRDDTVEPAPSDSAGQDVTTSAQTAATATTSTPEPSSSTTTAVPNAPATSAPAGSDRFAYEGRGAFPDVLGGPLDPHGSGCSPGEETLPDGVWFGFPTAWTAESIEFDLACFYSGEAATAEASARGEESPPPNDYIITNDNDALRIVEVAEDAIGHRLDNSIETHAVPIVEFMADPGDFQRCFEACLMWLFVNGGEVTEILSQYVP